LLIGVRRFFDHGAVKEAPLARRDLPWLAGALLAGGVGAPILLLLGLEQTPASTTSMLLNFEAVATALIASLVFREAVGKRILWAVGVITLSGILLSWTGGEWGFSPGSLAILGACLLWGLDNNFTRQISAKNPLVIVGIKGLGAGCFSLLLSLVLSKSLPPLGTLGWALLVGAGCYGLSIFLFILALRGLGSSRTGALFGIAPFIGTGLSFLFLGESPQGLFWLALPFMLAGAWLMLTESHLHLHQHLEMDHDHAHNHVDDHHFHEHSMEKDLPGHASHSHPHHHESRIHSHTHTPDLHHRHPHLPSKKS